MVERVFRRLGPPGLTFLRTPAVLAAALFSVVVVIPFLPAAKPDPRPFALELHLASSVAGAAKVYYDIGHGYRESDSAELPLLKADLPQRYRFPLPAGSYRGLRLDPTDTPGTLTLAGDIRLTTQRGRLVRSVPPVALQALEQIESLRPSTEGLRIVTTARANDPQLAIPFTPPAELAVSLRDRAADSIGPAAGVFVGLILLLVILERAPRVRASGATVWRRLMQRPARAVAVVGGLAVVASTYPVIFLGQSHVSPNFGTTLLYEAFPTVPGYTSPRMADAQGSDVGAVMWAHVPYSFMQHRALVGGELPLWNRYSSAGTPLLAQGQSMFGDPLHFFVIAFKGASWAWDLKFLVAKWLFALGLGLTVLALLRPRTPGPHATDPAHALPVALMVAFAAPFIGFFIYRINHPAFFSLCYAPWVLYGWVRLADAVGRRASALWIAMLTGANFALFNSGTVKEAYLLILQMNAAGACVVFVSSAPWRERLAKLAAAAVAGVLLILIMAPIWYPFLQTLRQSFTAYTHPVAFQIQPALLLGAFDELFFRPLSQGEIVFNPALNVLLLLGLLYLLATLRLHFGHRRVMALAACAVVTLAFSFGVVPPHGIARVPFLANVAHIENCFLCGFIVLGSVLAGVGFATAARRLGTPEGRKDLVIVGWLLLTLVGAWIGFRQASHRMVYGPGTTLTVVPANEVIPVSPFIWGSLAALLLASAVLAIVAQRAFARRALGVGAALLTALCVFVLLWRQGLHASAIGFHPYVVRPPERAPFGERSPAIDWVRAEVQTEPARAFGLHGNLTPGWNAAYGLENIHGPDALQNPWLRELIDVSPVAWSSSWRLYCHARDVSRARPFLDALNVRFLLDRASDQALLTRTLALTHTSDLDVYESRTAWPRAFFTNRLEAYADPAALMTRILAGDSTPFAAVHARDFDKLLGADALLRDASPRIVTPASGYTLTENSTSFNVRASGPGIVLLNEAWWPDSFRVEVDGRRQPVLRVNHAFKGVLIDSAGDHRIRFHYWPRHFLRTLIVSASGFVLLLAGLGLALRPSSHT